jgi:hypothetical protein
MQQYRAVVIAWRLRAWIYRRKVVNSVRKRSRYKGAAVVGVLFAGVFVGVCLAYACTEFAMTRFDVRRRVMVGESGLALILTVNFLCLLLLWISASILVAISGQQLYLHVAVIAVGAQAIWLGEHLWFYRRDHLRVRFEN